MKFVYLFWSVFIINLVTAIVLVNILPFKTHGEQTGFILSVNVLYFFSYGVFVLYTRFALAIIRRKELKKQTNAGLIPVKLVLHLNPLLAFYGALNIIIFSLPKAISDEEFMRLNGISMALGLIFGGARSLYRIRKYYDT